jgi:hypothetical protein
MNGLVEGRPAVFDTDKGLKGIDFAHQIKGSVPVQAREHR